jgi:epoxyqueuosine reductase
MARELIMQLATELGFQVVRFAQVRETPRMDAYDKWLSNGFHGNMEWMVKGRPERADPRARLASSKTALVLAMDYRQPRPPDPGGLTGKVAAYAWGRDYHNLIGKRLRKLRKHLWKNGIDNWGGVDTAPIVERTWAQLAGVGFVGKNTLTIRPGATSWFFLAVLFLDADVEPDAPIVRDHCGSCVRCLSACPTNAIVAPYIVDARKCISYWTIESPGLPPRAQRHAMGRWMFGCDDCQEVCPHNASEVLATEADFRPRNAWIDLPELLDTDDDMLMERFLGTPLRRPGAAGLKRNALLVLANLGDDRVLPQVRAAMTHPSPVVRASAVWCAHRLGDKRLPSTDLDELVMDEIIAATST